MAAFVAACQGEAPSPLTLADATEATRIGVAITRSLHSGQVEGVCDLGADARKHCAVGRHS